MDENKRKKSGYIYTGIGAAFLIAGIVFFVISNWINLYAQKAMANILAQYDVVQEDGTQYKLLEICYRVGNNIVNTTMEYDEEIDDSVVDIEIYYHVKNPKMVINGGWTFWPLVITFLGALIALPGLSYLGVIGIDFFEPARVSPYASEKKKKLIAAKERIWNSALPCIGAIGIFAFGVVLVFLHKGWIAWVFFVLGIILILYFVLDLIPAVSEWFQLKSIAKVKAEVVDTEIKEETQEQEDLKEEDE